LLDITRFFIVFDKTKTEDKETGLATIKTVKKLAFYHQYFAVNKAVESIMRAASEGGTERAESSGIRKAAANLSLWSSWPENLFSS